jgi:dsDNA-specific endonuclease/ATPase MutS2
MTAAMEAQMKVAAAAEELAQTEPLIDLSTPPAERRLTLEESMDLVDERYSDAIRLLGKL